MIRSGLQILALASVCVLGAQGFAAEKKESTRDKEAREAEVENAAESKLGEGDQIALYKKYSGKFEAAEPDDSPNAANPGTIGTLTSPEGVVYLLKVQDPGLVKVLEEKKKQSITVTAKARNNGKYLVVTGISMPEPVTPMRTKRGGV